MAGLIEAWGRGIEKIKDSCAEAGNSMPEYTVKKEDILVKLQGLPPAATQATTQTNENAIPVRIKKVIQAEPFLSQRQIVDLPGKKL